MGYTLLAGTRAPVRVWTDPYAIEAEAARQLRNIGQLRWVDGVAVMPDVHYGKGATVGSVIAMRSAISPAGAVAMWLSCAQCCSAISAQISATCSQSGLPRSAAFSPMIILYRSSSIASPVRDVPPPAIVRTGPGPAGRPPI